MDDLALRHVDSCGVDEQRVPARSALFASAAAARVPLAVTAPDSSPILAYDLLAERIIEVIAR